MISWAAFVAAAGVTLAVRLLCCQQRVAIFSPRRATLGASQIVRPVYLVGLVAGAGIGWVLFGIAGLVVGAVVGLVGGRWLSVMVPAEDAKRAKLMVAEFPLVVGLLASVVESGAPVRFAATAVSQVIDGQNGDVLSGVVAKCDIGFTDAEAWRTVTPDPVWGDLARELARCVDTGAATGQVLNAAAKQAGKSAAAQAITQARSVGVTSTLPLVCCFLPAFLLVGVVPIIGGLIGNYVSGF